MYALTCLLAVPCAIGIGLAFMALTAVLLPKWAYQLAGLGAYALLLRAWL